MKKYLFDVMLFTRPADKGQRMEARIRLDADARYTAVDAFWEALLASGFEIEYVQRETP